MRLAVNIAFLFRELPFLARVAAARDAGFEAAVTCQWRGSWDPFSMKRVMITGKDGPASFLLKVLEWYGPLFHSRAGQVARASTRRGRGAVRARREGTAG